MHCETLNLKRLENGYFNGNDSSQKMQEKLGYKMEGLKRKSLKCKADGEIKDEYFSSLLKEEWISTPTLKGIRTLNELIKISKKWKEKADQLLNEKGLVETLSKFGKVQFTGAYSYNLMMQGDIDISVVRNREFSVQEVFEIFREMYFHGKFRSYFIGGNWDDPRKGKEFPNGYYIGLKEKFKSESWKFDIWFVSEVEFANRKDNSSLMTLTQQQKGLILECKKYRNDHKVSITGQEIYDKVLGGEWKSIDDFKTAMHL